MGSRHGGSRRQSCLVCMALLLGCGAQSDEGPGSSSGGTAGNDATAGAAASDVPIHEHGAHGAGPSHADLPPARAMLPVEPWDGELGLKELENVSGSEGVVEVSLTAAPASVEYLPGSATTVWAYNGSVPGPVLHAKVGDRIVVHFTNMLPEPTTIHWHGMRVPSSMDGTSAVQTPVQPGERFDYEFVALDAGTFWYHPHIRSDAQLEQGLYGAIVVDDPSDPLAHLPSDVVVLSDALLDPATHTLDDSMDDRMMMMGREGNLVLVNGHRSNLRVSARPGEPHRLRIINAASARFFDLMVHGGTMLRVGGDRGLIEAPEASDQVLLANGERTELVVWTNAQDSEVSLVAMSYERAAGAGASTEVQLLGLVTDSEPVAVEHDIPSSLRAMEPAPATPGTTRELRLSEEMVGHEVHFMVNGASFPDVPPVQPALGSSEAWTITNESEMDHPFHLHGFFFVAAGTREWKDTINIPGKQSVTLTPYFDAREGAAGGWMYHCHILGHAEGGMTGEIELK